MEFTYNASALGAGGVLERTVDGRLETRVIPSLGSVALAPTGGEGTGVVTNYESEDLAFSRAETRVAGWELGKGSQIYTTFSDVLVTNLRIAGGRLNIALMHATVTSTRDMKNDESDFQLHALYRGVEVDGREIEPILDLEVIDCPRYAHFARLLTQPRPNPSLLARFNERKRGDLAKAVKDKETIQGSLVKDLGKSEGLRVMHHKIFIPDFGTVRFGELTLKPGRRRLNLLRIEFGKDEIGGNNEAPEAGQKKTKKSAMMVMAEAPFSGGGGSMTIASVEGNGTPILP